MDKQVLVISNKMRNQLDDEYILYDDGSIEHNYDDNIYPGSFNLTKNLKFSDINSSIKERLYLDASAENKEKVKTILSL